MTGTTRVKRIICSKYTLRITSIIYIITLITGIIDIIDIINT